MYLNTYQFLKKKETLALILLILISVLIRIPVYKLIIFPLQIIFTNVLIEHIIKKFSYHHE